MVAKQIDYDGLARQFSKILEQEQKSQWLQGKFLHDHDLVSDGQLQRLGQIVNRTVATLKRYREVYVQFREMFPAGPPVELPHGVLSQLVRIPDPEWREKFLANNPTATVNAAERAANSRILEDRKGRGPRFSVTRNLILTGEGCSQTVRVDGRLQADGTGDLVIDGITQAQVEGPDINGKFRLVFSA